MKGESQLQPHQERVIDEKAQLDEKISKLNAFLLGQVFQTLDHDEQTRMQEQADLMVRYSAVLGRRIAAFPK